MLGKHPLIRFINQNRREIRNVILVICVFFIGLKILNGLAEKNIKEQKQIESFNKEQAIIERECRDTVENFIIFCMQGAEGNAYALLSTECKDKFYNSIYSFKQNYIDKFFSNDKSYSINSFSNSENKYTFSVKIFDNVLSTGKIDSNLMIQEITLSKFENQIEIIDIEYK